MEIIKLTPNEVIERSALCRRVFRPKPTINVSIEMFGRVPLTSEGTGQVLGTGDWARARSTGGSVVIDRGDNVIKTYMGDLADSQSPMGKALDLKTTLGLVQGVCPPSSVIIAEIDGQPKPVVVQKKVNGKPLCETTFEQLLKVDILTDIKRAVQAVVDFHKLGYCFDLCGQHFTGKILGRLLSSAVFFSDNIMLDSGGKAYLIDNLPDMNTQKVSAVRKKMQSLRIGLSVGFIDIIISTLRIRDKYQHFHEGFIHGLQDLTKQKSRG